MKKPDSRKTVVFFDFDNTIATKDVFDDMLLRFAKDKKWIELEGRWKNKDIGSRECLDGQIKSIYVSKKSLDSYLNSVKIDPYFKRIISFLRQKRIEAFIVSDNFDYILKRVLKSNGVYGLKVYSNKAKLSNNRLMPFFPYKDKNCLTCAHCKKKTILSKSAPGELKIYIGDGQSDICPAKYADKIFAKDTLLKYCRKEKIPHTPYKNLKKVYDYLKKEY